MITLVSSDIENILAKEFQGTLHPNLNNSSTEFECKITDLKPGIDYRTIESRVIE